MKNNQEAKGFTLIELLVVIAILAVLAVAVVLVLNPAELIKQGRDSTRMSDLAALNSALALWVADVRDTATYGWGSSAWCRVTASTTAPTSSLATCTISTSTAVDGTGWLGTINFNAISSGAPLSKLPIDPINSAAAACKNSSGAIALPCQYAFVASSTVGVYEIDAAMESTKYTQGSSNVISTDNGNNNNWYEVGSNLYLFN